MAAIPKVQEPSMEEILASIRRIMADDDQPAPQRPAEPPPRGPRRPVEAAPPDFEATEPAPVRPEARSAGPRPMGRPPVDGAPRPRPVSSGPDHDDREHDEMNERPQPRREPFAAAPQPAPRPARPVAPVAEAGAEFEAPERAPAPRGPEPRAPQPRMDQPRMEQARAEPPRMEPPPRRRPLPAEAEAQQAEADAEAVEALFRANGATRRDLLSPNVDAVVAAAFQSLGDLVLPQKERTVEDLVKEILRPMLKDWLDHNLPTIVEKLVRAEIERVARRGR